jgi:peptidoglycan/xylan/chitin deacetylase (PgdA/CDA1 family)
MNGYAPSLMAAIRARGLEIVGHGRTNSERRSVLDETAERALIAEATTTIARHEGQAPRGWLSQWIAESDATSDLLKEAGYAYTLNWCMDDQPVWMRTRAGPLLAISHPQEANDIPSIVARKDGAAQFADILIDSFDEMLAQSARQPLLMGIALHPYIVGQPHRLKHLRRALQHILRERARIWRTTAGAIHAHVAALPSGTVPGDPRSSHRRRTPAR